MIDMYLCVMAQKPPDHNLAYRISERGDAAIPLVLAKLESASNEDDQNDLIYVFEVMSETGRLRGRKDVVVRINNVVERMRLAPIKADSHERLKKIETNSGVKL